MLISLTKLDEILHEAIFQHSAGPEYTFVQITPSGGAAIKGLKCTISCQRSWQPSSDLKFGIQEYLTREQLLY